MKVEDLAEYKLGFNQALIELEKWTSRDRFPIVHNEWEEGYNKALEFTIKQISTMRQKP